MKQNRFDFDAKTNFDAIEYMNCRAKQLIAHSYKLESIEEHYWGIEAFFRKDGKLFQSIYLLDQFRHKKLYHTLVKNTIVVSDDCHIENYLSRKKIQYVCAKLCNREYDMISMFYGDKKTKRSGIHLMNHIDEGLYILTKIKSTENAKKAFCLHPMCQSDEDLKTNYSNFSNCSARTLINVIEYRSIANQYLSDRIISNIDEIKLSPLKDVNNMLIADKIQNKKDFELYHKGSHPRSNELEEYFNNWMKRLNISDSFYQECFDFLK